MKPYFAPNRVRISGIILLLCGSIILGISIGAAAYFISNFLYHIFVFPLLVGCITMTAYFILFQLAKVRHLLIAVSMGLTTGIIVAFTFYNSPYLILRNEFIINTKKTYQVDTKKASDAFDKMLVKKNGVEWFYWIHEIAGTRGRQIF